MFIPVGLKKKWDTDYSRAFSPILDADFAIFSTTEFVSHECKSWPIRPPDTSVEEMEDNDGPTIEDDGGGVVEEL